MGGKVLGRKGAKQVEAGVQLTELSACADTLQTCKPIALQDEMLQVLASDQPCMGTASAGIVKSCTADQQHSLGEAHELRGIEAEGEGIAYLLGM